MSVTVSVSHLVRSSLCVPQLDVFFVFDSVQIFMKTVQQKRQKLLAVVLLVTEELRCKVTYFCLDTDTHTKTQTHTHDS